MVTSPIAMTSRRWSFGGAVSQSATVRARRGRYRSTKPRW
jgi:hypothetical protein